MGTVLCLVAHRMPCERAGLALCSAPTLPSSNCGTPDGNGSLGMAVCLVGFVRTLTDPAVVWSIARGFRANAERVDFYGVVSTRGNDTVKGQWGATNFSKLEQSVEMLRPVVWEDVSDPPGPPKCSLECTRQFDKLQRCGELILAHEQRCQLNYTWVVKARPDIRIRTHGRTLASLGMMQKQPHLAAPWHRYVWKDRTAGDAVMYLPRPLLEGFLRELMKPCPVMCDANGLGPLCKCNNVLTRAALMSANGTRPFVRMRYHPFQVSVARTPEALEQVRRAGFDHRLLHNRGREAGLGAAIHTEHAAQPHHDSPRLG